MSVIIKEGNVLTYFCVPLKNDVISDFIRGGWREVGVSEICYITKGGGLEVIVTDYYKGESGV